MKITKVFPPSHWNTGLNCLLVVISCFFSLYSDPPPDPTTPADPPGTVAYN